MSDKPQAEAPTNGGRFPLATNRLGQLTELHYTGRTPQSRIEPAILDTLHHAMLENNTLSGRSAIRSALSLGVRPEELADLYLPLLAEKYGELWCEDRLSFSDVTIAVARLQTSLRDLTINIATSEIDRAHAPTVLLATTSTANHTFGAFVVCGQLRRKGISVRLLIGATPDSIGAELRNAAYDAVFLSASPSEKLDSLRLIIDVVKAAVQVPPPIVVGGGIMNVIAADKITADTGADYATGRLEEALDCCGLLLSKHGDIPIKFEG